MLIARPIRCGPAAWATMVIPTGATMPPPSPCRTRNTIRLGADQARPASTEPAMKSPTETIQTGLVPYLSQAHPVSGITAVMGSR